MDFVLHSRFTIHLKPSKATERFEVLPQRQLQTIRSGIAVQQALPDGAEVLLVRLRPGQTGFAHFLGDERVKDEEVVISQGMQTEGGMFAIVTGRLQSDEGSLRLMFGADLRNDAMQMRHPFRAVVKLKRAVPDRAKIISDQRLVGTLRDIDGNDHRLLQIRAVQPLRQQLLLVAAEVVCYSLFALCHARPP